MISAHTSSTTRFQLIGLITVCLLLCSCVQSRQQAPDIRNFRTVITSNNIKLFELGLGRNTQGNVLRINQDGSIKRSKTKQKRLNEKQLYKTLDIIMLTTGFCKEGYLLLGRFAGEKSYRARGECKELATPQDKEDFPNTVKLW